MPGFRLKVRLLCVGVAMTLIGPLRADSVVIGALGDYGSAASGSFWATNELLVANLIKSWNPDFIITLGDNNYEYGEADTIDENVGQFFHEFIFPYRGAYGEGAVSNRFFPALGNRDWWATFDPATAADPYLEYFTLPGNERYYTYRQGPIEIFALDTDDWEPDGNTADSIQARWLQDRLAASTAIWRLVYFHHAPFSSGKEHGTHTRENANMNWPFKEWGASVVLAAHDHVYERVFTNGLTYFVNGLGGDVRDKFHSPPVVGSQVRYRDDYGALRIEATETNLTFRFFNVQQTLIDSHTLEAQRARLELLSAPGPPQLQLTGTSGRNYITEVSPDLVHWIPIATNQVADGPATVMHLPANAPGPHFYRARTGR